MFSFILLPNLPKQHDEWIQKVIHRLEQRIQKNHRVDWDPKYNCGIWYSPEHHTLEENILSVKLHTNLSEKTFTKTLILIDRFLEREKCKLHVHVVDRMFFSTLWLVATQLESNFKVKEIAFKDHPDECMASYLDLCKFSSAERLKQIVLDIKLDAKDIDAKTIEIYENELKTIDLPNFKKAFDKEISEFDFKNPEQSIVSKEMKFDLKEIIDQVGCKLKVLSKPTVSNPVLIENVLEHIQKLFSKVLNPEYLKRKKNDHSNDNIAYIILSAYVLFNRFISNENLLIHEANVPTIFETAFLISYKINEESPLEPDDFFMLWEFRAKTENPISPDEHELVRPLMKAHAKREVKFLEMIHWDAAISDDDIKEALSELKKATSTIKKINSKNSYQKLPHFFQVPTLYPLDEKRLIKIDKNYYVVDTFFQKIQEKKLASDPKVPLHEILIDLYEKVPLNFNVFLIAYIYFENFMTSLKVSLDFDWKYVILPLYKATADFYRPDPKCKEILTTFSKVSRIDEKSITENLSLLKDIQLTKPMLHSILQLLKPKSFNPTPK